MIKKYSENQKKYNLFLGDFFCNTINIPTRVQLAERFLSEFMITGTTFKNEDDGNLREYVAVKNSLSEVTQTYLDKTIGHKPDIIRILRSACNSDKVTNQSILDEIMQSNKYACIFSSNYDIYMETATEYNSLLDKISPFDFIERKTDKIKYYKIFGDISNEYKIFITSQDMKKMTSLSFYRKFFESLRNEIKIRPTIFLGVNLQDPDFLQLLEFIFFPMDELNQNVYVVPSSPIISENVISLVNKYNMITISSPESELVKNINANGFDVEFLAKYSRKMSPFEKGLYVVEGLESKAYVSYYSEKTKNHAVYSEDKDKNENIIENEIKNEIKDEIKDEIENKKEDNIENKIEDKQEDKIENIEAKKETKIDEEEVLNIDSKDTRESIVWYKIPDVNINDIKLKDIKVKADKEVDGSIFVSAKVEMLASSISEMKKIRDTKETGEEINEKIGEKVSEKTSEKVSNKINEEQNAKETEIKVEKVDLFMEKAETEIDSNETEKIKLLPVEIISEVKSEISLEIIEEVENNKEIKNIEESENIGEAENNKETIAEKNHSGNEILQLIDSENTKEEIFIEMIDEIEAKETESVENELVENEEEIKSEKIASENIDEEIKSEEIELENIEEEIITEETVSENIDEEIKSEEIEPENIEKENIEKENIEKENIEKENIEKEIITEETVSENIEEDIKSEEIESENIEEDIKSEETAIENIEDDIESKETALENFEDDIESEEIAIENTEDDIITNAVAIENVEEGITTRIIPLENIEDEFTDEEITSEEIISESKDEKTEPEEIASENTEEEIKSEEITQENTKEENKSEETMPENRNEEIATEEITSENTEEAIESEEIIPEIKDEEIAPEEITSENTEEAIEPEEIIPENKDEEITSKNTEEEIESGENVPENINEEIKSEEIEPEYTFEDILKIENKKLEMNEEVDEIVFEEKDKREDRCYYPNIEEKIINIEQFKKDRSLGNINMVQEINNIIEREQSGEKVTHIISGDNYDVESNLSKKFKALGLYHFPIESKNLTETVDYNSVKNIGSADIMVGEYTVNSANIRLYICSDRDVLEIKTREFALSIGVLSSAEKLLTRANEFYKYQIYSDLKNSRLIAVVNILREFFSGARVMFNCKEYTGDFEYNNEHEVQKFKVLLDSINDYDNIINDLKLPKEKNISEMKNSFYSLFLVSSYLHGNRELINLIDFEIPNMDHINSGDNIIFEKIHKLKFSGIGFDMKEIISLKEPINKKELINGKIICQNKKIGITLSKLEKVQEMVKS